MPTCLRDEGNVILPVSRGLPMTPVVISLHRRQTQAQDTTLFRSGHWSSLFSTLLTISPNNSGRILDHRSSAAGSSSPTSGAGPIASPKDSTDGETRRQDKKLLENRYALRRADILSLFSRPLKGSADGHGSLQWSWPRVPLPNIE